MYNNKTILSTMTTMMKTNYDFEYYETYAHTFRSIQKNVFFFNLFESAKLLNNSRTLENDIYA